jgi:hypothetical protein
MSAPSGWKYVRNNGPGRNSKRFKSGWLNIIIENRRTISQPNQIRGALYFVHFYYITL